MGASLIGGMRHASIMISTNLLVVCIYNSKLIDVRSYVSLWPRPAMEHSSFPTLSSTRLYIICTCMYLDCRRSHCMNAQCATDLSILDGPLARDHRSGAMVYTWHSKDTTHACICDNSSFRHLLTAIRSQLAKIVLRKCVRTSRMAN